MTQPALGPGYGPIGRLPLPNLKSGGVSTVRSALVEASSQAGITYGVLAQRNPIYDGKLIQELEDLYVGGYRIQKRAKTYLTEIANEGSRYEERCKSSAYLSYFGEIVDQFAADLFGQPLSIKAAADAEDPQTPGDLPDKEYYDRLEKDVDRRGTSLLNLLKKTLTTALVQKCAVVCIDAPNMSANPEPANLADEESQGARNLYAYDLPLAQLIDWEEDDRGGLLWCVLYKREQKRLGPIGSRNRVVETFTTWELDYTGGDATSVPAARAAQMLGATGSAVWKRYEVAYEADKPPPRAEDIVPLVDQGVSSFDRIPVFRLELPDGLWIGNKLGPIAKEHYQRRSALNNAQNRSLVAIPVAALGPEIPGQGAAIAMSQTEEGRGDNPVGQFKRRGFMTTGWQDKVYFAEPEGRSYEIVSKQLGELKDEMFRINHLMAASVSNNSSSLGRSGLSKQKDEDATIKVLRALGGVVRDFAVELYEAIAKARNEDVIWTPHGLDQYSADQRLEVLQEAVQIDMVGIESPTFKKQHKYDVATKLLGGGTDPATLSQIREEINDAVDSAEELRQKQMDQAKDKIDNPEKYQMMGMGGGAPGAPKPAFGGGPPGRSGAATGGKDDGKDKGK